ncbi:MAG: wax ester/triacylglycerol synthase family O-acyltransferase [Geodermatophilaceae bacterium]|nr:wax ester/triacylglycerol synthase family O-acyltransferase [Geodermatophilaceae bacterium]
MADRLSALDVSFLYVEEPTTPMHVGGLAILQPPDVGFDYDRLVELIEGRIGLVPRYRQKIKNVPGRFANPVWIDDGDFDVTYHVRRSALPRPGNDAQLRELTARLMSRRLDRSRPLWEIYLVEGLAGGRIGLITKTHHAMVDGLAAVDLGQVLLDLTPTPRDLAEDLWMPAPEPGPVDLVAGAVEEYLRRPTAIIDTVRSSVGDARATVGRIADAVGGFAAAASLAARPAPTSPLNATIGEQRRFGVARTSLEDYRRVRSTHGGTVNDVVLATVSLALRNWLLSRGEPVTSATTVRALVPLSVRTTIQQGVPGNRVSAYLIDLPVGEASPAVVLAQVGYAMRAHKDSGQSVGADALIRLSGFAPPTLHALGARAASGFSRRLFNTVVSNVPGPQLPLYAGGARLLEMFPVVPLARGQAVSIGVTSYDGGVYYGLNADRDAMGDVDVLGLMLEEAITQLAEVS